MSDTIQRHMILKDIVSLLDGTVVTDDYNPDFIIKSGLSSDLMSDVLTIHAEHVVLLTGLCNLQTIRTAEMAEVDSIVIVRNKTITQDMIELANEHGIHLIQCEYTLYKASGILYSAGLKPVY